MVLIIIAILIVLGTLGNLFGGDPMEDYKNSPQFERDRDEWVLEHWDELN